MLKKYTPSKYTSYLLFLLPLAFYFFIDMSRESDIWFLLSHGREVLKNGIPHIEFLTIHNGFSFVMQQWLSSTLFYIIYNYLGDVGLYIFIYIINLIIIFFLYKICMIISNGKVYASVLITVITDLLLELIFIIPRPQIFSILILIIELYILELFIKNKSHKSIYFIILLSILLINLHSSIWPILFIFMGPYLAELLFLYIKKKDKRFIKLLIIFMISILVGFINPYGIEGMTYFMRSYGIKEINLFVGEMHHIGFDNKPTSWLSMLLIVYSIIAYYLTYKNRKNVSIHQLLFLLGTTFMAYLNLRNSSLFFISTLPFLSNYISIKDGNNLTIPYKTYLLCLIVIIVAIFSSIKEKNYILKSPLQEIVNYLDKNANKDIKLFTNFGDGPYFEYNNYKVYIDSRAEVFLKANNKKEDVFLEYINLLINKLDIDEFLKKYNFDYLVVQDEETLYKHLKRDKSYELVYDSNGYYLFKRINNN